MSVSPRSLPKLCGGDIELSNSVLGLERYGGTGREASRALLREIVGLPDQPTGYRGSGDAIGQRSSNRWGSWESGRYTTPSHDPRDWGRRFLATNGGCIYIDLDHLELCLPEVHSAFDHVAAWHAMLRIARDAMVAANAKLPRGQKLQVMANNSDGLGHAFGSHLDFLITRNAWDGIFERKLHHLLFLAAYQVSSIIFTGQGKVGSENGRDEVEFQLTQRGDFFETLVGPQTTFRRPIVNSRDEPLCGPRSRSLPVRTERLGGSEAAPATSRMDPAEMARLHVIFYDSGLCHVASLLKVGVLQIVLAMIEADSVDSSLILDEPLRALHDWGHDPELKTRAKLSSGMEVTAVELQMMMLAAAQHFADGGGCDGVVPRAAEILELWGETLEKLKAGGGDSLADSIDWVLKRAILQRAIDRYPHLDWRSPEIKHLDHLYSSLDLDDGLYWAYERDGALEQLVSDAQIERFVQEPPGDTRAFARAMLLRHAAPGTVDDVDWDMHRGSRQSACRDPARARPPVREIRRSTRWRREGRLRRIACRIGSRS